MLSLSACAEVDLLEEELQLDDKREALKSLKLADVVRFSSRDANYSGRVVEIQQNNDDAVAELGGGILPNFYFFFHFSHPPDFWQNPHPPQIL